MKGGEILKSINLSKLDFKIEAQILSIIKNNYKSIQTGF